MAKYFKNFYGEVYLRALRDPKVLKEKEIFHFWVSVIATAIVILKQSIWLWSNKFELGVQKYLVAIGNGENSVDISNILATIYCVAQLLRLIILYTCTVYQQSYKLLLPVTQVIDLVSLVFAIGRRTDEDEAEVGLERDLIAKSIVMSILLYSSMRPSVIICVSSHSVALFLIRPVFNDLTPSSLAIHFASFFVSVVAMAIYEKLVVIKVWSKLKLCLANDELLEVVNASNQGILFYCRETNRLFLQN